MSGVGAQAFGHTAFLQGVHQDDAGDKAQHRLRDGNGEEIQPQAAQKAAVKPASA